MKSGMSQEILKGQWKELRGRVKEWWGNLTDDDVNRIDGNHEKLVGALQQRYGYAKDKALSEISRRIDEFSSKSKEKH
jgi:uncharacterized protein YjbJ (UPF0337 family)